MPPGASGSRGLDETVDVIKGRFGSKAATPGQCAAHPLFSVLDPDTNNTIHPVPSMRDSKGL